MLEALVELAEWTIAPVLSIALVFCTITKIYKKKYLLTWNQKEEEEIRNQ